MVGSQLPNGLPPSSVTWQRDDELHEWIPEPTVRLLVLSLHLLGRSNFCRVSPTILEEWKRFSLIPEDHADLFLLPSPRA